MKAGTSPVRPRPAASLILVRGGPAGVEVLLGRRGMTARFMPGRFVFPGGGVTSDDARPWLGEAAADTDRMRPAERRAVRAALRETFEETGFLLAAPATAPEAALESAASAIERAYQNHHLRPDLAALRPVGRAITPSFSPIRFHARFFLADGGKAIGPLHGGEELEKVGWYAIEDGFPAPMSGVTRFMLRHALSEWRGAGSGALPLYHYVRGNATVAWIGESGPVLRQRVAELDE